MTIFFERYSAVIAGESLAELMIASGTVFNQILLWFVRSDENEPEPVRVSFNGHQVSSGVRTIISTVLVFMYFAVFVRE